LKISLFTCRHSLSQVGRGPSSFGSQLNMFRRLIFSSSSPKGTLTTRVPAGRTGLWRRNEQVNAKRQLDFSAAAGGEEEYGKGVRGEGAWQAASSGAGQHIKGGPDAPAPAARTSKHGTRISCTRISCSWGWWIAASVRLTRPCSGLLCSGTALWRWSRRMRRAWPKTGQTLRPAS